MTASSRDELLSAIDALARAAFAGDPARIERRRRDAHALARLLVPPPLDPHACQCGLRFRTSEKLAEHEYHVHDGPTPEHWQESA